MAAYRLPEWPAEPWVGGQGYEAGCIFQEGEVEPIAIVDVWRTNGEEYATDTAARIVACVNAMAGIEEPEAFIAEAKRLGVTAGVAA